MNNFNFWKKIDIINARKILWKKYDIFENNEIQDIIDTLYKISDIFISNYWKSEKNDYTKKEPTAK